MSETIKQIKEILKPSLSKNKILSSSDNIFFPKYTEITEKTLSLNSLENILQRLFNNSTNITSDGFSAFQCNEGIILSHPKIIRSEHCGSSIQFF